MKFVEKSLTEFVNELASPSPTPGGGGASALIGALGISLGDMVGELTVGKKKYADVEAEIKEMMAVAQALKDAFLRLVDADAEVFAPLAAAYGIPKDAPGRAETMEAALRDGAAVPFAIMETCAKAIDVIAVFAEKGSRLAVSDAGCAAAACKAALQAASLNVFINTKAMQDRAYAADLEEKAGALLAEYGPKADAVFDSVLAGLRR